MTGTRIHTIWKHMKERCDNKNCKKFPDYGGRGISYCEKWSSFLGFYEDMKSGYSENLQLDRIDVNGCYSKENCRWATRKMQQNNMRNNIFVSVNGVQIAFEELAKMFNQKTHTMYCRLYRYGWTLERTLTR